MLHYALSLRRNWRFHHQTLNEQQLCHKRPLCVVEYKKREKREREEDKCCIFLCNNK